MNIRLENAAGMLRTTKQSCTDIAQMCGFSDSGQMAKMIEKFVNSGSYEDNGIFFQQSSFINVEMTEMSSPS